MITKKIKVISQSDSVKFEELVNIYLNLGWDILSTSCGFVNSEVYDFCESYQAILIKESREN